MKKTRRKKPKKISEQDMLAKKTKNSRIRYQLYKTSIPLLVSFSRPLLVLVLILLFWSPLVRLIKIIPSKLERTSEISIGPWYAKFIPSILDSTIELSNGNLILTLVKDAITLSDPPADISQSLTGLSAESITFLIKEPNGINSLQGYWCETSKSEIYGFHPEIIDLERSGLIEFTQKHTITCDAMWYWGLSDSGGKLYLFLNEIVIKEFMKSLEKSS